MVGGQGQPDLTSLRASGSGAGVASICPVTMVAESSHSSLAIPDHPTPSLTHSLHSTYHLLTCYVLCPLWPF